MDPVPSAMVLLLEHDSTVRVCPRRVLGGSASINCGLTIDANGSLVFPLAVQTDSNVIRLKHIAVSSEVEGGTRRRRAGACHLDATVMWTFPGVARHRCRHAI
jgi:hypothetical protein